MHIKVIILFILLFLMQNNSYAKENFWFGPKDERIKSIGIVTHNGLKIKQAPGIRSLLVRTMEAYEIVRIIKIGKKDSFNGIHDRWYYCISQDKNYGWVFGGYLFIIPKEGFRSNKLMSGYLKTSVKVYKYGNIRKINEAAKYKSRIIIKIDANKQLKSVLIPDYEYVDFQPFYYPATSCYSIDEEEHRESDKREAYYRVTYKNWKPYYKYLSQVAYTFFGAFNYKVCHYNNMGRLIKEFFYDADHDLSSIYFYVWDGNNIAKRYLFGSDGTYSISSSYEDGKQKSITYYKYGIPYNCIEYNEKGKITKRINQKLLRQGSIAVKTGLYQNNIFERGFKEESYSYNDRNLLLSKKSIIRNVKRYFFGYNHIHVLDREYKPFINETIYEYYADNRLKSINEYRGVSTYEYKNGKLYKVVSTDGKNLICYKIYDYYKNGSVKNINYYDRDSKFFRIENFNSKGIKYKNLIYNYGDGPYSINHTYSTYKNGFIKLYHIVEKDKRIKNEYKFLYNQYGSLIKIYENNLFTFEAEYYPDGTLKTEKNAIPGVGGYHCSEKKYYDVYGNLQKRDIYVLSHVYDEKTKVESVKEKYDGSINITNIYYKNGTLHSKEGIITTYPYDRLYSGKHIWYPNRENFLNHVFVNTKGSKVNKEGNIDVDIKRDINIKDRFVYNKFGFIKKKERYGSGNLLYRTEYSYYEPGILKSEERFDGKGNPFGSWYYYNSDGLITEIKEYENKELIYKAVYFYDGYQIISEKHYDGSNNPIYTWREYSKNGILIKKTDYNKVNLEFGTSLEE